MCKWRGGCHTHALRLSRWKGLDLLRRRVEIGEEQKGELASSRRLGDRAEDGGVQAVAVIGTEDEHSQALEAHLATNEARVD